MKTKNLSTSSVIVRSVLILASPLFLAACGGGGDSGATKTLTLSSDAPTSSPDPEASPTPIPGPLVETQMNVGRAGHLANLLNDGRVLVVGGTSSNEETSAEIFDPSSDTWTMTATPFVGPRAGGKSLKLQDGRILYVGGEKFLGGQVTPTKELVIFDPADEQFHVVASQNLTSNGAAATLLSDGRVLLTGGAYFDYAHTQMVLLRGSEIFDPTTNSVTPTWGQMLLPRAGHSATLMNDGLRVLIAGGTGSSGNPQSRTEVFQTSPGAFVETNPMREPTSSHFATLLPDGAILTIGGFDIVSRGLVHPVSSFQAYATGGAFDLVDGVSIANSYGAAYLAHGDGTIAITGGQLATNSEGTKTSFIYDSTTNTLSEQPELLRARSSHTMTLLPDGSTLVVGGFDSASGGMKSAERIQP